MLLTKNGLTVGKAKRFWINRFKKFPELLGKEFWTQGKGQQGFGIWDKFNWDKRGL